MLVDELLTGLDGDQLAAVAAEETLIAVVAAAGSGKTTVVTRRIAHRIATEQADEQHVLAVTFTRQAAGELRRRLDRAGSAGRPHRRHVPLGGLRAAPPALGRPVPVGPEPPHEPPRIPA